MSLQRKFYELYKKHLADFILVAIIFGTVFYAESIPYVNILITSIDPLLTSAVIALIALLIIIKPSLNKVMFYALAIFPINFIFVVFNQQKPGELLASFTYTMIFTVVAVEIFRLKKEFKKKVSD